jgi:hypothetical protein
MIEGAGDIFRISDAQGLHHKYHKMGIPQRKSLLKMARSNSKFRWTNKIFIRKFSAPRSKSFVVRPHRGMEIWLALHA